MLILQTVLSPDHVQQNVVSDLDPKCLTVDDKKHANYPADNN